jgi:hypothetical protein
LDPLPLIHEDEGITLHWNVGKPSSSDTEELSQQPRVGNLKWPNKEINI